jgi:hypothetical protein
MSDEEVSGEEDRQFWPDSPCPAWCDRDHPAFREHLSSGWMCYVVVLSTEDSVADGQGANGCPQRMELYIEQDVREVGPRVVMGMLPTGRPRLGFLPAEARHLGEALIRLAAMAVDDSGLVRCEPCRALPI